MRLYAKAKQAEADAWALRTGAERQPELMLSEQKAAIGMAKRSPGNQYTGPGYLETQSKFPPTLAGAGIDENLAHRARTFASMEESEFETMVDEGREHIPMSRANTRLDVMFCDTGFFKKPSVS